MMTFDPLWATMKKRGITTYNLITYHGFSRGLINKLKHNRNVTLETVERLCKILDCQVQDVVRYEKDE